MKCAACKKDERQYGEVCQACAYAIQAHFADNSWMQAPYWLRVYVYGENANKAICSVA